MEGMDVSIARAESVVQNENDQGAREVTPHPPEFSNKSLFEYVISTYNDPKTRCLYFIAKSNTLFIFHFLYFRSKPLFPIDSITSTEGI